MLQQALSGAALLRLLSSTAAATAAPVVGLAAAAAGPGAAAGSLQQIMKFFCSSSSCSSSSSSDSSLRWNAIPHTLPQLSAQQLQVPAHELEEGELSELGGASLLLFASPAREECAAAAAEAPPW
jgi:hypothetical protein